LFGHEISISLFAFVQLKKMFSYKITISLFNKIPISLFSFISPGGELRADGEHGLTARAKDA
jgi:hypothetical protein